jgi:hypothetical protein
MDGRYEIFYGEDGEWEVWKFMIKFDTMESALQMATYFNEGEEALLREIREEGGENDTN